MSGSEGFARFLKNACCEFQILKAQLTDSKENTPNLEKGKSRVYLYLIQDSMTSSGQF